MFTGSASLVMTQRSTRLALSTQGIDLSLVTSLKEPSEELVVVAEQERGPRRLPALPHTLSCFLFVSCKR